MNDNVPMPCIVHWRQKHFIVVYKIKNEKIWVADPAVGLIKFTREEFVKNWASTVFDGKPAGLVLIIEPTPALYNNENEIEKTTGFRFLFKYFHLYRKYLLQLVLGSAFRKLYSTCHTIPYPGYY